uniref:Putative tail protein n=1 Tax=viral metagenome TaxID=1070528 RepID=A0A6M3JDQ9_9ZZZZ
MSKSTGFKIKELQTLKQLAEEKLSSIDDKRLIEIKHAIDKGDVGGTNGQVIGAVVGGVLAIALAPFTAGLSAVAYFGAAGAAFAIISAAVAGASLGAAIGGMIDPPKPASLNTDSSSGSPTYGFDASYNTTSNQYPVPILYGKVKLAGNNLWFSDAETTTLHKFVGISEGEINSVTSVKLNDIDITEIDGCSYDLYTGTSSQSVDARADGAVNGLRYTAYMAVTMESGDKLRGGSPILTGIYEGIKVKTWNGSSWSDDTSYSNNPAACVRDFLSNTRYGAGMPESLLDDTSFGEVYDYCEQLVDKADGSGQEKRYSLNICLDNKQAVPDMLQLMLCCFGGYLILSGTTIKLGTEKSESTTQSFTEDTIVAGSLSHTKLGKDEVANRIKIQYVDPNYNWIKIYAIAEDKINQDERVALGLGEKIIEKEFSLLGVTSFSQASRLANMFLYLDKLCDSYITFKTSLRGVVCEVGDVISVTHSMTGWTEKLFKVLQMRFAENDTIEIISREYNDSIYSDNPGQEIVVPNYGTVTNELDPPDAPDTVTATESGYLNVDGTWIPTISAEWTDNQNKSYLSHYNVQWKRGGGDYFTYSTTSDLAMELSPAQVDVVYVIRVQAVTVDGLKSSWTASNSLTINGRSDNPDDVAAYSYTFKKSLILRWDGVSDNDLSGYEIRDIDQSWGDSTGLVWRGNTTDWVDPNPSSTSDTYYVKAFNNSGYYSANALSMPFINEVPLNVTGFTGTFDNNISLSWNNMDTNSDLDRYEVRTSDANWGVSGTSNLTFNGYALTAENIDPSGARSRTFYIKAFDVHGQESVSASDTTVENDVPETPTLTGTVFADMARLSWNDLYDIDLKYYEVWEDQENTWNGNESKIASINTTHYELTSNRDFVEGITKGTPTSTVIGLSGTNVSSTNDYYNGDRIFIKTSGTVFEERTISDYNGTTNAVTISPALTYIPAAGVSYHLDNTAYYKVVGVDNYGSGTFSNAVQIDYTQISGSTISDGIISGRKLITGEIITLSAQIRNAIIDDAHINSVNATKIVAEYLSAISANLGTINAGLVQGGSVSLDSQGSLRSNTTGNYPYLEFSNDGLMLKDSDTGGTYGTAEYSTDKYGYGASAWIMNSTLGIPFAELKEPTIRGTTVASLRLYNRGSDPDGTAEVGDIAVVNGKLKICISAGTPGTFQIVGEQTS